MKYRQPHHKEYVGDDKGDLHFNHRKYFEFHSYPGEGLHKLWVVCIMLLLLFLVDDLFAMGYFYGFSAVYIFYISIVTHFLLIKKICRHKGYFLYPNSLVQFFKKRKKSVDLDQSTLR